MTTKRRSPSRRTGGRRGPRPKFEWDTLVFGETIITPAGQGIAELTENWRDTDTLGRTGATLIRMIGSLTVRTISASVLGEWAAGIAYIAREAQIASAFPDPGSDGAFPWLWFQGAHEFESTLSSKRWEIDVRSQRKFREPYAAIYGIFDNHSPSGNLGFAFNLRILYRLP